MLYKWFGEGVYVLRESEHFINIEYKSLLYLFNQSTPRGGWLSEGQGTVTTEDSAVCTCWNQQQ